MASRKIASAKNRLHSAWPQSQSCTTAAALHGPSGGKSRQKNRGTLAKSVTNPAGTTTDTHPPGNSTSKIIGLSSS